MKLKNDWSKEYSQDGELPGPSTPAKVGKWLKSHGKGLRVAAGVELLLLVCSTIFGVVTNSMTHAPLEWCVFWWFVLGDLIMIGIWLINVD